MDSFGSIYGCHIVVPLSKFNAGQLAINKNFQ